MLAPGQAKKVAKLSPLDHVTRQLILHTRPIKRSSDFLAISSNSISQRRERDDFRKILLLACATPVAQRVEQRGAFRHFITMPRPASMMPSGRQRCL